MFEWIRKQINRFIFSEPKVEITEEEIENNLNIKRDLNKPEYDGEEELSEYINGH